MKVIYRGVEYPIPTNPLFEEISFAERKIKQPMDEWTKTTNVQAMIFWAIRRVDPQLLSWDEIAATSPNDYEMVDDEDDGADADPPEVTPSTSPDGPGAAEEPSRIGSATT